MFSFVHVSDVQDELNDLSTLVVPSTVANLKPRTSESGAFIIVPL